MLLHHALRRDKLCRQKVKGYKQERRGVAQVKISAKGRKTRYVPLHPAAGASVVEYLEASCHRGEDGGALIGRCTAAGLGAWGLGGLAKAIMPDAIYKIARGYSAAFGFGIGAHALRATAATNALDHQANSDKVPEWLGHANIATIRIYDRRKTRPEDNPGLEAAYPHAPFRRWILNLSRYAKGIHSGWLSIQIDNQNQLP